jgi:peptide/nickel transport system permease protein
LKADEETTVTRTREFAPIISELRYMFRLFIKNPLVFSGSIVAIAVIVVGLIGPFLLPSNVVTNINLDLKLQPPSEAYPLGTDDYGRDLLGLIVIGTQLDLKAAFIVVGGALLIGVFLGAVSGYAGGKIDEALMRITDIFLAFPSLILAMAVAAVLGPNVNNLIIAITLVWWPSYTRLTRGQVLAEKERPYVDALRALGISRSRIVLRHIIVNTIYPILINATLDIGGVILTFAGLSFLGFGAGPFTPEWGQLVARGETYIFQAPWLITYPGLLILTTSLAFNLVGDGLRDVLDPRLRR